MTERTYKLEVFNLNKGTIKNTFQTQVDTTGGSEEAIKWAARVEELLSRRTQSYTLPEITDLIEVLDTSHLGCVLGNPEDFSPVEVWQAEQMEKKIDRAQQKVKLLSAQQ